MVQGVGLVTKVAVRVHVTLDGHLLVVPGCGKVLMADIQVPIPATADHTGGELVEAAHSILHGHLVVRGHLDLDLKGVEKYHPTVHQTWY